MFRPPFYSFTTRKEGKETEVWHLKATPEPDLHYLAKAFFPARSHFIQKSRMYYLFLEVSMLRYSFCYWSYSFTTRKGKRLGLWHLKPPRTRPTLTSLVDFYREGKASIEFFPGSLIGIFSPPHFWDPLNPAMIWAQYSSSSLAYRRCISMRFKISHVSISHFYSRLVMIPKDTTLTGRSLWRRHLFRACTQTVQVCM